MAAVLLQDLILPAIVSLLHAWQLANFARQVGKARGKFKVPYPAISGDDDFMRYFRAQQNAVEFAPIFFPLVWIAALFFHPVPAAIAGVAYYYGRKEYFTGYIREVKGRLYGFGICVNAIKALLVMAVSGIVHTTLVTYADINVKQKILEFF